MVDRAEQRSVSAEIEKRSDSLDTAKAHARRKGNSFGSEWLFTRHVVDTVTKQVIRW